MSSEKNDELRTTKSKKKPNKGPYLLGEPLGEGAFAKVRRRKRRNSTLSI